MVLKLCQMSDPNNDSIWEITIPILEGTGPVPGVPGWEFKFSVIIGTFRKHSFLEIHTYTALVLLIDI